MFKFCWPYQDRNFWVNNIFDLEFYDDFFTVHSISDCDVVFLGPGIGRPVQHVPTMDQWCRQILPDNVKVAVIDDLSHAYEHLAQQQLSAVSKLALLNAHVQIIYLTSMSLLETPSGLPKNVLLTELDLLFNRTKAYYTGHPYKCLLSHDRDTPWYFECDYNLDLNHRYSGQKTRIFLACGRCRPGRSHYRRRLLETLRSYRDLGHWSQTVCDTADSEIAERNHKENLASVVDDPLVNGTMVWNPITRQIDHRSNKGITVRGYSPPHPALYASSYISIYSETLEHGDSVLVTEKTYDPLIRGHFILPFGSANTVKAIQQKGFWLPNWINYSYDADVDDEQRYETFQRECIRLINQPLTWWSERYREDLDNLVNNQRLFWKKSYSLCTHFLDQTSRH